MTVKEEKIEASPVNNVIKVDQRARKVFKTMFHVPSTEKGKISKAIKWDDFKRAMVRTGFSAEKLQGSTWQFEPLDKQKLARGIQFHEPHPDNDIPSKMAKQFGARLERAYGRSASTFKIT